mmetsp:Transcript_5910/g.22484  ORF Transcript_5910/g.22484 Transcript_5910/m.22484 type:complete len:208 (+) Transcript_5910:25-648(+)
MRVEESHFPGRHCKLIRPTREASQRRPQIPSSRVSKVNAKHRSEAKISTFCQDPTHGPANRRRICIRVEERHTAQADEAGDSRALIVQGKLGSICHKLQASDRACEHQQPIRRECLVSRLPHCPCLHAQPVHTHWHNTLACRIQYYTAIRVLHVVSHVHFVAHDEGDIHWRRPTDGASEDFGRLVRVCKLDATHAGHRCGRASRRAG